MLNAWRGWVLVTEYLDARGFKWRVRIATPADTIDLGCHTCSYCAEGYCEQEIYECVDVPDAALLVVHDRPRVMQ